ncbi:MAG: glycoside hydrolase family 57 protein [Thermodesulfobacteriota bacterium]|nr:glycoside hydrolase family 57 protein [Thermodesulfobacteriota bacterium]
MKKEIHVVLCWHMHQPYYRDGLDGNYHLPWVYLHAIKDYADMVAHLGACPKARVVVNVAPVLLEQLDDYGCQMRQWLRDGVPMSDPLLNLVVGETPVPPEPEERAEIITACQRIYAPTMIDCHPPFRALVDIALQQYTDGELDTLRVSYLGSQFFVDLLMWYHLAWLGTSVKRGDARVIRLMARKNLFTRVDQILLLEVMAEVVEGIIPSYRALMEAGQIELSMSPYGHPIVPLLIDFNVMHDAQPAAHPPRNKAYPGGMERAKWHMERGFTIFEKYFGMRPRGVWLSEGGISSAALALLDQFNIDWTASGEGVWRASCDASKIGSQDMEHKKILYRPLCHPPQQCKIFFRDDGLSDLIGFVYKDWDANDAANDFCHHMENIATFVDDEEGEHVVTVILDGENAWEYYPDNGYHFLHALYAKLTEHPGLKMSTFSDLLHPEVKFLPAQLTQLKAGSWVHGSFSTWIGDKDKNAAWDLLVEVKECYDRVVQSALLSPEKIVKATEQLAICEGSDWFWWFGDLNPAASVRDFDQLFRRHLIRLYQLLEKVPPQKLKNPLSHGGGDAENAGTMRRN